MPRSLAVKLLFTILPILLLTGSVMAQSTYKYAMSMFHFNIQYVAGGLIGFLPVVLDEWEQTQEQNEDQIVIESFEPVLDLYLAHPGWGVNLEMQAYMVEVLAERHPRVLDKLRTLADRGQAEIVCFHYSDQLFIAYPFEDWRRSWDLAKQVFEENDLPLGKAVFCQEGQAGMGMAGPMADRGYKVMVWPKNLIRFNHGGDFTAQPYYNFGDIHMVAGSQGVDYNDGEFAIKVNWTFFGDGELLATGDLDPYFPPIFVKNEEALAEYEKKLTDLETDGYDIATVTEYVDELIDLGVEAAEPMPLLDGTWQPQSHTTFRWMGGGALWRPTERDNHVRTLCAAAHRELVAAETVLGAAEKISDETSKYRAALDEAWRLLALGQVTDATGINPYKGEVGYGLAHAGEALRMAREVIEQAGALLDISQVSIDSASGSVLEADQPPDYPLAGPALFIKTEAHGRLITETWRKVADDPEVFRLQIDFSPGDDRAAHILKTTFYSDTTQIIYCEALADDQPVYHERIDFGFEHYHLALANGLLGLDDNLWLIKDQGWVHVAADIFRARMDVEFVDETASWNEQVPWVFYVVRGDEQQAVEWADRINVHPTLTRTIPGDEL